MGWNFLGQIGIALALGMAAVGSAVGIGRAGIAAAGAWGKEGKAGKALRFTYIILVALPLSQTLYAMIVMNQMRDAMIQLQDGNFAMSIQQAGLFLGIGVATGLGEMLSAWMQGTIGAAGCRAMSDADGKGLAFIIIAMGIVETVGIFAFVFLGGLLSSNLFQIAS